MKKDKAAISFTPNAPSSFATLVATATPKPDAAMKAKACVEKRTPIAAGKDTGRFCISIQVF